MSDTTISFYVYPGITPSAIVEQKGITFEIIRDAACDEFNLPFDEIASSSQKRIYVEPRQMIQTLAETLTSESQTEIGKRFRGRDSRYKNHTTVVHARSKFYEHYELEREYRTKVRKLLVRIGININYFDKKTRTYNMKEDECILR